MLGRWILLGAVLGLALVPSDADAQMGRSVFTALDTQGRAVALGGQASGSLTDDDLLSAGGRRIQVWTLGAAQGEEVQVDLISSDFDAFLYEVGPGLNEGLRDDDGGNGLNSRICFTPDESGEYRVVASSLSAGTGAFSISAVATGGACGGVAVTNEVEDLAELPVDDRVLASGDIVDGYLTDLSPTFYGSPVEAWAVQGTAGSPFAVDLISDDFDAFLTVLGPGLDDWIEDDDGAGACHSRVTLTFPEDGTYMVVASTLGTSTGAYQLVANDVPGDMTPGACVPGTDPIDTGGGYVGGDLDEVPVIGSLPMETWMDGTMRGNEISFRDRPVQGWTLEGMAGTRVAITLISDQFDTYLFFNGPGFSEPLTDDDSAGDLDSRICVQLPETGTYGVFAGPLYSAPDGSTYEIQATVAEADDLCTGAFDMSPAMAAEELAVALAGAEVLSVGDERTGYLSGEFVHPESGRPVEPWLLRGTPGQTVFIDVIADYDAYLYVLSDEFADGYRTADDFDGSLNPRMEVDIPANGELGILAAAFSSYGEGEYRLRITTDPPPMEQGGTGGGEGFVEGEFPETSSTADPSDLDGLGAPVGELVPVEMLEIESTLGPGDDVIYRGYAEAYTIQGQAGDQITIELISDDFDCYLYFTGPGLDVLYDDDGAGSLDSRIQVTLPMAGTYTVVATSLSEGSAGTFRLRAFREQR